MNKTKDILLVAFALFSLFFGAGNLLLPPFLGFKAGEDWFLVTLGFTVTAVVIPIIGIIAHAKIQGTLYDFGKKVSVKFSYVYCILIYIIALSLPSPRTAAATHEMAVSRIFQSDPLWTSTIYFSFVLLFVLNRTTILDFIGKFLTPVIVVMLLLVIGIGLFSSEMITSSSQFETPLAIGILEGYQTFDAIGAVVVGAVIIISINSMNTSSFEVKKDLIIKSGILAGLGLFTIYAGLIAIGSYYGSEINLNDNLSPDMQRANLLRNISKSALGGFGNAVLSLLISLACFTTAVGIVTGAADYFQGLCNNSHLVYVSTAILGCILGIVIGQLDFNSIVIVAVPVLLFIYPITIVLIVLNVLSKQFATPLVFKVVILITFLFSVPDVIGFIRPSESLEQLISYIPFAKYNLGWVLPAFVTCLVIGLVEVLRRKKA